MQPAAPRLCAAALCLWSGILLRQGPGEMMSSSKGISDSKGVSSSCAAARVVLLRAGRDVEGRAWPSGAASPARVRRGPRDPLRACRTHATVSARVGAPRSQPQPQMSTCNSRYSVHAKSNANCRRWAFLSGKSSRGKLGVRAALSPSAGVPSFSEPPCSRGVLAPSGPVREPRTWRGRRPRAWPPLRAPRPPGRP